MTERISAQRTVPAAPEAIFEVLTDPDGHVAIEGTVKPPIGHVYGYELTPHPDGTTVTSYCDWSAAAEEWKPAFPVIDEKALRTSLGLLERAVRRGYPTPAAG